MSSPLSPRKHIVIACANCGGSGSVASVALHHAAELSRDFNVTLISDSIPAQLPEGVSGLLVRSPKFSFLRRFAHVPNEVAFCFRIYSALHRLHRDKPINGFVCHSHSLAALSGAWLRRHNGIPCVMVTHGDIFHRPEGTYDSRLTLFFRLVTPPAYKNANRVVALSPFMAECAVQGGASLSDVSIIPNGIDPEDIGLSMDQMPPPPEAVGTLKILYIGRFGREKGVETLIKACGRLYRENVDFSLRLIGDGPLRGELQELTKTEEIEGKIGFEGLIRRKFLGNYYLDADVVCVPSISEPLATVVLEGMTAGRPVVASDVGGNPFMIEDGRTGFIFPVCDDAELARIFSTIQDNRSLLQQFSQDAVSVARERFSWHATGVALSKLLSEIGETGCVGARKSG